MESLTHEGRKGNAWSLTVRGKKESFARGGKEMSSEKKNARLLMERESSVRRTAGLQ